MPKNPWFQAKDWHTAAKAKKTEIFSKNSKFPKI